MARGRFLSRTIGQNEQLASVSLEADYLFARMVPYLDVEGRMSGNPRLIKSDCVPLRSEITLERIPELLAELAQARDHEGRPLVVLYEVGTKQVLCFPGFEAAQQGLRKDREAPSKLPPPPGASAAAVTPELVRSSSGVAPDEVPHKRSEREVEVKGEAKAEARGERATARLASLRDRFFATFYGGATAERRAAVDRQLDEALSRDGCVTRRRPHPVTVHATHTTLANALEATLGEGVRKSDSAIVVVLKKLESGRSNLELDGDGRTQTETMAVNHREVARVDAEDRAALLAEAWAYAEQHPDAWGARRAMIEAEHPDPSGGDPRETWVRAVRQGVIDGALLAFYHERAGSGAHARQSA